MDGLLIVDKPAGWTSHDVVARVRRTIRERRVGHTGTLDPLATGVLVVLVGRATRLAQFLAGAEKEYEALVRLGYATDTGDLAGERRGELRPCRAWARAEVEAALGSLRGEVEQVPPMYSAKKVQGKKLYELARRGVEVEREAVRVTVRELEAVEREGALLRPNDDGTCDLGIRVVCSAGTYVRVLAEDLGTRLGTGAHLVSLRRTRAGAFRVERAVTPGRLEEIAGEGRLPEILLPPEAALPSLPCVHLTDAEARRVRHGAAVGVGTLADRSGARVRLHDGEGKLLAVGEYDAGRGLVRPRVMLAPEPRK